MKDGDGRRSKRRKQEKKKRNGGRQMERVLKGGRKESKKTGRWRRNEINMRQAEGGIKKES